MLSYGIGPMILRIYTEHIDGRLNGLSKSKRINRVYGVLDIGRNGLTIIYNKKLQCTQQKRFGDTGPRRGQG